MQTQEYWHLIKKESKGELNLEEQKRLQDWREENPENQKMYEDMKLLLKASEVAPPSIQVERQWETFRTRVKDRRAKQIKIYLSAAASVVAFGLVAWFVFLLNTLPGMTELQSQAQEIRQITLPDGTKVWLNENTSLGYYADFNQTDRTVYLQGEAFFEVVHDTSKTFSVHSYNAITQVLGTSFMVSAKARKQAVEVLLESGKVKFSGSGTKSVTLRSGQRANYNPKKRQIILKDDFNPNQLAWKNEELKFRNASLKQVFKDLADHYQVVIDQSEIEDLNCSYSGSFKSYSFAQIKEILEATLNIQIEKIGEQHYQLRGNPCEN